MDELLEQFLIEGRELVADAHAALARLKDRDDRAAIDGLFRAIHTLKGSVALFDMAPAETLLHAAEDQLAAARKGDAPISAHMREALVGTIDQVDRWIDAMERDGGLPADAASLSDQLRALLAGATDGGPVGAGEAWLDALRGRPSLAPHLSSARSAFRYAPDPDCFFRGEDPLALVAGVPGLLAIALLPEDSTALADMDPFRCTMAIEGVSDASPGDVRAAFRLVQDQVRLAPLDPAAMPLEIGGEAEGQTAVLRVEGARLDRLARQAGELAAAVHGLRGFAARVERVDRALADDLRRAEDGIARAEAAIRGSIADIRLVSLTPVLRRLPRLARELALSLGKDVEFSLGGDGAQVDKHIADALFEPLLHLVRNAIDHGIEPSEQREAAGKAGRGKVVLDLAVRGDRLAVTLRDDGGGIDPDRVRRSAVAKGLVPEEAAAALTDMQAQRLIFTPGFSTAADVSSISGRGIGMDAVLRTVERLQGSIDLRSTPGAGTAFHLDLPLNAITTRLMTVTAGGMRVGIRLDQIVETMRVERHAIHAVGAGEACVIRDQTVPIVDLGSLLGQAGHGGDGAARIVVTQAAGDTVALRVDALGDRLDALVRERSGLLANVPGIAGTCVLVDGSVLLVIDLAELLA